MTNYQPPLNEYSSYSGVLSMYERNMMNMNNTAVAPINFAVSQPTITTQATAQNNSQVLERRFFHHTPDNNFYHITCQIIPQGSVFPDDHDYDHGFIYQHLETSYYVKCKLFSHSVIVNILNREIYGIDIGINNLELRYSLHLDQKIKLEQELKRFLPFYFMQNHIPKRKMRTDSENMFSMTDNQNNFGNQNGFCQNVVGGYNYNVTHPNILLKKEMRPDFGNAGNNVVVTPLMPNNQNDIINDSYYQNRNGSYNHNVIHPQQRDNNVSSEREMRSSFNSFHGNVMTTSVMTDNQNNVNNDLHYQNEGYIHNDVIHLERQSDLNNMPSYTNTNENIRYNVMETQANSMTDIQNNCSHHQNGVEDIQQVSFNSFPQRQISGRETRPDYSRNASLHRNDVITNDVLPTGTDLDNQR